MKKLLTNIILFAISLLIMLLLASWILSAWVARQDFNQSNTESNLMILEKDQRYDYLIIGNSHARNFSRHGNHSRMEQALDKKILNLGQGLGIGGINAQTLYLKYALDQGVQFDKLIYALSPPFVYGDHLNHSSTTFFHEPLHFDFFLKAMMHRAPNKFARLHHYLRSKARPNWLKNKPNTSQRKMEALSRVDSSTFEKGFELAYPFGMREVDFMQNAQYLEEAVHLAMDRDAEVILLSTPTLFGDWPGQERVARYCDSLSNKYAALKYLNLTHALNEPRLFYDHHHLNSEGIDSLVLQLKGLGL